MAITVEVATASEPHESPQPHGRSDDGAAAARTEALFAEYGRTVSGLCRALLRDGAEAEDAAQQTFLSAHRALLKGTEPREPAAWLATIARNECWARIRTRMREPLPTSEVDAVSTANDPLAEAIRRADLRALWAAIEELPRKQRDALLLREFGGMSYVELSAALAVSGPAVESLLFRARDGLRGKLRAVYGAITGASWLEAIIRVAVGGGAPVAAKVAVLGLGAAAVGGGAVVAPHVYDNHHPSHGPLHAPAAVVVQRPKARPAAPVVVSQVVTTRASRAPVHTPVARSRHTREQEGEHAGTGRGGDGGGQAAPRPVQGEDSHSGSGRGGGHDGGDDGGGGSGGGRDGGGEGESGSSGG